MMTTSRKMVFEQLVLRGKARYVDLTGNISLYIPVEEFQGRKPPKKLLISIDEVNE